jgi:(S)-sulfolactate dehydrogenase
VTDIVISEFMDPVAVEKLKTEFDVLYDPDLVDHPAELADVAAVCRGLIVRNRTQVRGTLLDGCRNLRVVGRLGVGLDNIDIAACGQRGIAVMPATGANTIAVAECVITGLLMLLRGAYQATAEVLAGDWPRRRLMGREAYQRRLGLIGFGAIARAVAERAAALGMSIAAYDPYLAPDDPVWQSARVRSMPLDGLLAGSDVISLHVPLSETTHHLIDAAALRSMKPGAILINTARGGVVDEHALAESLRSGHLGGALLDVFEQEPLAADSHLLNTPNLILTPHIAGVTEESNQRVSALTAENVSRVLRAGA